MGHRVNIMLDEDACKVAITAWFKNRQRIKSAQKMDVPRAKLHSASTRDIVRWVREDRADGRGD